jgi:hypothetical protein
MLSSSAQHIDWGDLCLSNDEEGCHESFPYCDVLQQLTFLGWSVKDRGEVTQYYLVIEEEF